MEGKIATEKVLSNDKERETNYMIYILWSLIGKMQPLKVELNHSTSNFIVKRSYRICICIIKYSKSR